MGDIPKMLLPGGGGVPPRGWNPTWCKMLKISNFILLKFRLIDIRKISHERRPPCALSIREVSRKSVDFSEVKIAKCEIWGFGDVAPLRVVNVPVYPRNFGHSLRPQTGGGILEICLRVWEQLAKNWKNVNCREIETGSGRGQMTSWTGSGPRGLCCV